jgi:hypothetical protein
MKPFGHPLLRGAVALAVLVPLLAACGGSSSSGVQGVASLADSGTNGGAGASIAPTGTVSQKDREAALIKAAQCMRDHGLKTFPDPTVDSNGNLQLQGLQGLDRNNPSTRTAFEACRDLFRGARPQFTPEQRQKLQDTLLKYAKCMRQNGYQMADPTFGEPGAGQTDGARRGPFGDINRNDPAYKKAQPICQPILAGAFPGGGPGGGPGGPGGPPPPGAGIVVPPPTQ